MVLDPLLYKLIAPCKRLLGMSAALVLMITAATPPAAAQEEAGETASERPPRSSAAQAWFDDRTKIAVGAAGLYRPEFEGSDSYELQPFPLVSIRNLYGLNVENLGASYDLLAIRPDDRDWEIRLGPALSLDLGRDEDDNEFLDGLGDVSTSVLGGAFVSARYGPIIARIAGGHDIAGGHEGTVINARVASVIPLTDEWRIIPGVTTTWASADYMQSFFGITETQAADSIYQTYTPDSGFKDVGANLTLRYLFAENWAATGTVAYKRLVGPAADSPIVEGPGGSADQFLALIGLTYEFSF